MVFIMKTALSGLYLGLKSSNTNSELNYRALNAPIRLMYKVQWNFKEELMREAFMEMVIFELGF